MQIVVLNVYARSGGTLINKCLGALPNTIVLSEISRFGMGSGQNRDLSNSIAGQMNNWYNVKIKGNEFFEQLLEVIDYCIKENINLVIRDWVFIYFSKNSRNAYDPCKNLEIVEFLRAKQINFKTFAFVRDSIDIWISRGKPNINLFTEEYGTYVEKILSENMPVFKYELFCKEPEEEMKRICKTMNLPFSKSFLKGFLKTKANGDTQLGMASRGERVKMITKFQRKWVSASYLDILAKNEEIKQINRTLNYETDYFSNNFSRKDYFFAFPIKDTFWNIIAIAKNKIFKKK